jgi:uncharacterized MAPEG superfamily protein
MTVIDWLMIAAVLGLVHLLVAAHVAQKRRTIAWNVGPRDVPMETKGVAARLERAYRNFLETFPLFAAAALAVVVENRGGNAMAQWGTALYVVARIVYVPLYAAGIPYLRTLVWTISIVGLVLVIVAAF